MITQPEVQGGVIDLDVLFFPLGLKDEQKFLAE